MRGVCQLNRVGRERRRFSATPGGTDDYNSDQGGGSLEIYARKVTASTAPATPPPSSLARAPPSIRKTGGPTRDRPLRSPTPGPGSGASAPAGPATLTATAGPWAQRRRSPATGPRVSPSHWSWRRRRTVVPPPSSSTGSASDGGHPRQRGRPTARSPGPTARPLASTRSRSWNAGTAGPVTHRPRCGAGRLIVLGACPDSGAEVAVEDAAEPLLQLRAPLDGRGSYQPHDRE